PVGPPPGAGPPRRQAAPGRLRLDTHVWLWILAAPERLSRPIRSRLGDATHQFDFSAASVLEIAIKQALGRMQLPGEPLAYLRSRLGQGPTIPLPIQHAHALRIATLPRHHRDPFDRMLVAQAQVEGHALLTADPVFRRYEVEIIRA